ncbi:hypothetical protein GCM10010276_03840 [Streptomyces longisporus]|uniref:Uncharacterized protein n=1 Tax=Streptomyces longisporus TaxID=1948 RepID=A0ABN3KXW4_STRLO
MRFDVRSGFEGVEEGVDTGGVDTLGGGAADGQRESAHEGILPAQRRRIEGCFPLSVPGTRRAWCKSDTR